MGNTQCSFCNHPTNITNYSCKYKKNICTTCINYIRSCSLCNEWYTNNLIRYSDKLYCLQCLDELCNYKTSQKCKICNQTCNAGCVHHQNKYYCNECIENIYVIYSSVNKKLN